MRRNFWVTVATILAANASLVNSVSIKSDQGPLILAESHSDAATYSDADIEAYLNGNLDSDIDTAGTEPCEKPKEQWIKQYRAVQAYDKCKEDEKKAEETANYYKNYEQRPAQSPAGGRLPPPSMLKKARESGFNV